MIIGEHQKKTSRLHSDLLLCPNSLTAVASPSSATLRLFYCAPAAFFSSSSSVKIGSRGGGKFPLPLHPPPYECRFFSVYCYCALSSFSAFRGILLVLVVRPGRFQMGPLKHAVPEHRMLTPRGLFKPDSQICTYCTPKM